MKIIRKSLALILAMLIMFSCVIVSFAQTEENGPVVQTEYGMVKGLYYDGGECYYGIPYAKATTGKLRFMPPVAPDKMGRCSGCKRSAERSHSGRLQQVKAK